LFGHLPANRPNQPIGPPGIEPADHLLHNHHSLFASNVHSKYSPTIQMEIRTASCCRELNILRVIVDTAYNEQFFQPAGNEQLIPGEKAHISGTQKTVAR